MTTLAYTLIFGGLILYVGDSVSGGKIYTRETAPLHSVRTVLPIDLGLGLMIVGGGLLTVKLIGEIT